MSSINVSKGLFRLWVLFALCWAASVTVLKFDSLTASRVGYYDPKLADQIRDPFDNSPAQMQINIAKNCKNAKITAEIWLFCDDHQKLGFETVAVPVWSTRIHTAEWVFLPPLALLLLGYGMLWAVRGFKE
jgi:hypothetical protein